MVLGTHPLHTGRGIGMALLAENLARIDREQMPAYLESSNPANNHRYQRCGFEAIGEFYPPGSDIPSDHDVARRPPTAPLGRMDFGEEAGEGYAV